MINLTNIHEDIAQWWLTSFFSLYTLHQNYAQNQDHNQAKNQDQNQAQNYNLYLAWIKHKIYPESSTESSQNKDHNQVQTLAVNQAMKQNQTQNCNLYFAWIKPRIRNNQVQNQYQRLAQNQTKNQDHKQVQNQYQSLAQNQASFHLIGWSWCLEVWRSEIRLDCSSTLWTW